MATREQYIAHIKDGLEFVRDLDEEKYQVDVPDWLVEELADFLLANGPTAALPQDLLQRAAEAGVAVWSDGFVCQNGFVAPAFRKKFELTDPVRSLLDLEKVGMQTVEGLSTIQDLINFIGTFPGILPYLKHDSDGYLPWLFDELQIQGFVG